MGAATPSAAEPAAGLVPTSQHCRVSSSHSNPHGSAHRAASGQISQYSSRSACASQQGISDEGPTGPNRDKGNGGGRAATHGAHIAAGVAAGECRCDGGGAQQRERELHEGGEGGAAAETSATWNLKLFWRALDQAQDPHALSR